MIQLFSITEINGYTLFPHAANWSLRPSWKRTWQTGVATGVDGSEQRSALRSLPLHSLSYSVTAASLPERSRLDARIDQATKSGLGCTPFFGKGSVLAAIAAAGSNALTLTDAVTAWSWAAGDYAALLGADDSVFDVWQVTAVAGNVLTLAGNLANAWRDGMVRPLLFGKFSSDPMSLLTDWHASVKLSFVQIASERNAQLGVIVPDTGTGVGHQTVGSTNVIG
jgi:hypothetical protein